MSLATTPRVVSFLQCCILRMIAEGPWELRSATPPDGGGYFWWSAADGAPQGSTEATLGLPRPPALTNSTLPDLARAGLVQVIPVDGCTNALQPWKAQLTPDGAAILAEARLTHAAAFAAQDLTDAVHSAWTLANARDRRAREAQAAAEAGLLAAAREMHISTLPISHLDAALAALKAADAEVEAAGRRL
jgi:hypothetical protein